MARTGEPQPDLGKLRLGLGLSAEEAAARIGITPSILVNYESKGYGYDPEHDARALDTYLLYAVAAYGSEGIYRKVFPLKEKSRPVAPGRLQVTTKGN